MSALSLVTYSSPDHSADRSPVTSPRDRGHNLDTAKVMCN